MPQPRYNARQPFPFFANEVPEEQPRRRWPWLFLALLVGITIAFVMADWFLAPIANLHARQEPRSLATTPAPITPVPTTPLTKPQEPQENGSILQVDRTGTVPRLPGAASPLEKHAPPLTLDQQSARPRTPGLVTQTSMVRLPPLSLLTIYFPKPFAGKPEVALRCETVMPSEVTIDEVTEKYVKIRNSHPTNDCYFRYEAEGKTSAGH